MRFSLTATSLLMLALAACPDDGGTKDTSEDATTTEVTPDATTTPPDSSPTTSTTRPDTSVETDTSAPGCVDYAPLSGSLVQQAEGAFVLGGGTDLGFGGPQPDALVLEFFDNDTGTFDLGLGPNANFGTCEQCVRVVQDLSGAGAVTKQLFATGGTIGIDPSTPPEGANLKAQFTNVTFREITIFADFHSEEVDNGACYESGGDFALETAECTPSCEGRICGSDSCDGTCGEGCDGTTCALDGTQCEATPACYQMTVAGGALNNQAAGVYQLDTTSLGLGGETRRDIMQLEFYAKATGTFDLGVAPNTDYATCTQCVRVVIDGQREFFQADGELELTADSQPVGDPDASPPEGKLHATLSGVRLIEVTYDEDFRATPVVGGACIDLITEQPFTKAGQ